MQSNALLPLLSSCIASYFVSYFLMENTIMTEKIARRGVNTPHSYEPDILEKIRVEEVMADEGLVINDQNTITELKEWLKKERIFHDFFIIAGPDNGFRGIVRAAELSGSHSPEKKIGELTDARTFSVNASDSLRKAVELMADENTEIVAVTGADGKLVSVLSYRDILPVYKKHTDDHKAHRRTISMKRKGLKILIRGQKLITVSKRNKTPAEDQ
jgi:Mg/Co/Ni transporter MgtE